MNRKVIAGVIAGGLVVGGLWLVQMDQWNVQQEFDGPRQLIFIGDTQERVDQLLGLPSIEFPQEDSIVRWYAGYEVTLHSNVVIAVNMKPIESEEERAEKALRAKMAEEQLRASYDVVAQKERISYNVWLAREEKRLQAEREERAKVEEYNRLRSAEKRAAIYAEGRRRSCGCRSYRCRHH